MAETGKQSPASPRSIAVSVLRAVWGRGAFASAALDAELAQYPDLDPRDRALATELSYGVLRTWRALEQRLLAHAPRGIGEGAAPLRLELLVAAYQLLLLDRIPAFAVVHDAVERVGQSTNDKVRGFVNAVLRRVAAGPKLSMDAAIAETAPVWLREALVATLGNEQAMFTLGVNPDASANSEERVRHEVAPACVRLRPGVPEPAWLVGAERGTLFPAAYRLRRGADLRNHPEFASGAFVQQEEGAMVAAAALGVRAGDKVLDACAGHGQKSSFLAERIGHGELWVTDKADKKLLQLAREFERLELPSVQARAIDWSRPGADVPRDFDRILVDAPCTGSGTLRHRPEIALRLTPEDPKRLAALSLSILRSVHAHVRPGGRVVFVVCSLLREEAEAVVERALDLFAPCEFDAPECPALLGSTVFRTLPGVHGTDGYFLASLTPR